MKKSVKNFLAITTIIASVGLSSGAAVAARNGIDSDTRIRTLIYSDSEVFRINMQSGFQTDVELAPDENIDTLSIGDSIGWQITPASHRIFIKPLQKTGITNLSVITNRRSYHFELVATNPTKINSDHAYVVKFYYGDADSAGAPPVDRSRNDTRPVSPTAIPEFPTPKPALAAKPPMSPPVLPGETQGATEQAPLTMPTAPTPPMAPPVMPGESNSRVGMPVADGYNFNYTISGPELAAPTKIYDDGHSTFLQFRIPVQPGTVFARVNADGTEAPVSIRPDSDGKVIIDQVAPKFTIRSGSDLVCVFNEQMSAPNPSLSTPPVPAGR